LKFHVLGLDEEQKGRENVKMMEVRYGERWTVGVGVFVPLEALGQEQE